MTHLGQRLSALIDGELSGGERERVLLHITRCGSCRDEVAALRTLKKRMNALGEAAVGSGLTGRLMSLREAATGGRPMGESAAWPRPPGWEFPAEASRPEQRTGRYFLAGSLVIVLAGLGTAAFIAGGDAQAQAPSLPVTPSVDVLVVPHDNLNGSDPRRVQPELPRTQLTPRSLASPRLP